MDKPVEPDLQSLHEDLAEVFRKHEYGDESGIAAKKAIEETIKYIGISLPLKDTDNQLIRYTSESEVNFHMYKQVNFHTYKYV